MSYAVLCPACRQGRHQDHVRDWAIFDPIKAGPFLCGGATCSCDGLCTPPNLDNLRWEDDGGACIQ